MGNYLDYKFHIDYSKVDNTVFLSFDSIFDMQQIAITEFFKTIDFDNLTMKNKYNCAWVITKTKLKINKLPYWGNDIKTKTYITNIKPVKTDVETAIYDMDDNLLMVIKDEMCVIDLDLRKIRRLKDFSFTEQPLSESIFNDAYEAIDESNLELFDNVKVKFCDIDCTNHTNNVSYLRFIMNSLGKDFFNNVNIKMVDMHYKHESLIDEKLDIYKSDKNNIVDILIKRNDDPIFSIKIQYEFKS